MDLRENANGRFLKLSVIADGKKFVAVPGEAIVEFRDKFAKLLDKHPITEPASPSASSLPPPKSLQVDRKTFYFDVDKNDRGVFVKVSEVRTCLCTIHTLDYSTPIKAIVVHIVM